MPAEAKALTTAELIAAIHAEADSIERDLDAANERGETEANAAEIQQRIDRVRTTLIELGYA